MKYLASEKTLVIEETVRERHTSGIAFAGGAKIGDGGGTEGRVGSEGVKEEVVEESREKRR